MRFTQDLTSNVNLIRGYAQHELRVNDRVFRESIIVSPASIISEPGLRDVTDLAGEHVTRILQLEPEVVLVGTGARQVFPPAAFGAQFLRAGVGFEVMDTGAACRTFNVLVGEQRRVAALLLL